MSYGLTLLAMSRADNVPPEKVNATKADIK